MDLWVKTSGKYSASELTLAARAFAVSGDTVFAYYPDRFIAAAAERLSALPAFDTLLELRIFNADREFWAHRSSIGRPFAWRIADDVELKLRAAEQEDLYLRKPENHYVDTAQTLDIDATADQGTDEFGSRRLRTTVGGSYALPIAEGDGCVKIRGYIQYDANGMAVAADYRLMGFGPQARG